MSYTQIPLEEGESPPLVVANPRRRPLVFVGAIALISALTGFYFTGYSRGVAGKTALSSYASGCLSTKNVAMYGADLVEYFSLDAGASGVLGSADYTSTYGDSDNTYTFYFKDAANLALFEADPTAYLPQYGGFCSWGIAEESVWTLDTLGPSANPDVWEVIDGKLYFFMFDNPRDKFMGAVTDDDLDSTGDTSKYITDATARWADWFDGAAAYNTDCFWFDASSDGKEVGSGSKWGPTIASPEVDPAPSEAA
mmetsp:Transcript_76400/g.153396  ORF Transcript_76400/g.153396 Transcript_76400/m.153396 type:complete len:253 (+) Transcript_76400:35-793(+)